MIVMRSVWCVFTDSTPVSVRMWCLMEEYLFKAWIHPNLVFSWRNACEMRIPIAINVANNIRNAHAHIINTYALHTNWIILMFYKSNR